MTAVPSPSRSKCPGNLRGHTWREPEPALLPEIPRRDLFALRVCRRCGELGRVNSQGVVVLVDKLIDQEVTPHDFRGVRPGAFVIPKRVKARRRSSPRIVNVSFDVTQEVAAALRALRNTGLFGNGIDCASVAEELLRRALLDPEVVGYWRKG